MTVAHVWYKRRLTTTAAAHQLLMYACEKEKYSKGRFKTRSEKTVLFNCVQKKNQALAN